MTPSVAAMEHSTGSEALRELEGEVAIEPMGGVVGDAESPDMTRPT